MTTALATTALTADLAGLPEADLVARINAEHRQWEETVRTALDHAVLVGDSLIEAKSRRKHSGWTAWVERHCDFDIRTAQMYMGLPDLTRKLGPKTKRVSHLPLRDLVKLRRLDDEERSAVVEVIAAGEAATLSDAVQVHRQSVKTREREEASRSHPSGGNIITGDMQVLFDTLEDDSVPLFFSDPPWDEAGIGADAYGNLARLAAVKLRAGGFCFAYVGAGLLDVALKQMGEHLTYWWQFCIRLTTGHRPVWGHHVWKGWRPVLVMCKGPRVPAPEWVLDHRDGGGTDKRFHEWGQDAQEATYWIENFTKPGDLVVDPYCGGGAIPAACKATGRKWLATEVNAGIAAVARKRVASEPARDVA